MNALVSLSLTDIEENQVLEQEKQDFFLSDSMVNLDKPKAKDMARIIGESEGHIIQDVLTDTPFFLRH
jgi:hypothetical protein